MGNLGMHFKSLQISEWQQFADIQIEFHDRLTILTGANGSGKTTLLNLLARHQGWNMVSLATPKEDKISGVFDFVSRWWLGENRSEMPIIGSIEYTNNSTAKLEVSSNNTAQYQVNIRDQQEVRCFYIPSHRPIYRYQQVKNIPNEKKKKETAFEEVSNASKQLYHGGLRKPDDPTISSFIKNTLIGWVIQGYGVRSPRKVVMVPDPEQASNFEGFQEVLRKILPGSIGFEELEIREMEVVFICNGGQDEFLLETASGGISAIIDVAWQIYMYSSKENKQCTVLIDEVENHLHPSMQRQILSDLLLAFPDARFIVSTHSPLVIGSVKESRVYALQYNEEKKVESNILDFDNSAKTASEILDEVLGVSVTMPIWAEKQLDELLARFATEELNENSFVAIRDELLKIGLSNLLPDSIEKVLRSHYDQT